MGQRPTIEFKCAFLNTPFGLELANKKFGISEVDIEGKIGRYSRGKYKGLLRGKICWWKIVGGGFQPTGYRDEDDPGARVPGFVVKEVGSSFGFRITDYEQKKTYWGPEILTDSQGNASWKEDYLYIFKGKEHKPTVDLALKSKSESSIQTLNQVFDAVNFVLRDVNNYKDNPQHLANLLNILIPIANGESLQFRDIYFVDEHGSDKSEEKRIDLATDFRKRLRDVVVGVFVKLEAAGIDMQDYAEKTIQKLLGDKDDVEHWIKNTISKKEMKEMLNKEDLKKLLEKAGGDVCPVCHQYIHRGENTKIGEDGQEYHADCYAQIKDKMEATPRWKRFFKAPEDYLQTENKKKLREMIIGETSNE